MIDETRHSACVRSWFSQAAAASTLEIFLMDFEQAFAAVWRRAHVTLGNVTLSAILDRVIHNASERCSMLSLLTVDETGLRCQALAESAPGLEQEQVEQGLQLVLVEFLTILGNLTAEVLTPALHAELAKVARERAGRRAERAKS